MQPASDAEPPEAIFARHRAARLHEAAQIWAALQAHGFSDDDVLLLDFTLFGRDAQAGEALAAQIAATYATSRRAFEPGGWMCVGTTRPYGSRFTADKLRDWAGWLSDLAAAHGYLFSVWAVEAPRQRLAFTSEQFPPETAA